MGSDRFSGLAEGCKDFDVEIEPEKHDRVDEGDQRIRVFDERPDGWYDRFEVGECSKGGFLFVHEVNDTGRKKERYSVIGSNGFVSSVVVDGDLSLDYFVREIKEREGSLF